MAPEEEGSGHRLKTKISAHFPHARPVPRRSRIQELTWMRLRRQKTSAVLQ
jgi:hypothetical protein